MNKADKVNTDNKVPNRLLIEFLLWCMPFMSRRSMLRSLLMYNKFAFGKSKQAVSSIIESFESSQVGAFVYRAVRATNLRTRRNMAINLIAKGLVLNEKKRKASFDKGEGIPTTILISPTMCCNLKCRGCYAANYSQKDDLSYEVVDRVVTEAEEMGVGFITLLGGEPFIWKDIMKLFASHPNMYFQVYSNATLIDDAVAKKLSKLGNVMPMLSVEGFEEETDNRREPGVYKKVIETMVRFKKVKVPFGFSVAVTKQNEPVVASEKFIDSMIAQGALVGWYFLYMPVGKDPDLSLMPTPKQRLHLLKHDNFVRKNKPIFIADFWNDAPLVGGCIAARFYIHITSDGWVEPCIFSHYAQDNIKEVSLKQAMNSKLFKKIRSRQPYNDNLYLPCAWIDNPEVSREIDKEFDLHYTHPGADDILKKEELVRGIDEYSKEVKKEYDKQWEKDKGTFTGKDKVERIAKKFGY